MKKDFSCEKCQDILFDYASDLLDKKLAATVLAHISTCSDCKKKFDEIDEMLNVLHSCETVNLPDDFDSILHMNLVHTSEEMKQNKVESWWKRIILNRQWKSIAPAALAFVLVVSVTSTGLYQHFKNESDEFNMSEGVNGTVKTETSSPIVTPGSDFVPEIIQNDVEATKSRAISDSLQNNNSEDTENNEYIPSKNEAKKPAQSKDSVQDKDDGLQNGNIQTFATNTETKSEDDVQNNGQQDSVNSDNRPASQSEDEFVDDTHSIPQSASIEDDAYEAPNSSETTTGGKPFGGGGGGAGVSAPRMSDTICNVRVDDINSFLNGYGYSSLSDDETKTTITISEGEFEGFKSYAKKTGAELAVEAEGNSGVVYITISE